MEKTYFHFLKAKNKEDISNRSLTFIREHTVEFNKNKTLQSIITIAKIIRPEQHI